MRSVGGGGGRGRFGRGGLVVIGRRRSVLRHKLRSVHFETFVGPPVGLVE